MNYLEISKILSDKNFTSTKELDKFNKSLIKSNEDVSGLKDYILKDEKIYRTFFQVSLALKKDYKEQFQFIDENLDYLKNWWHVDSLLQFIKKPLDYEYIYNKAKIYILDERTYVRRLGYVINLLGLQKDSRYNEKILNLIKDDLEFHVITAEAWLIADIAVYDFNLVYDFLNSTKIKYQITSRAIQKICDSYRISKENKERVKLLRSKLKLN